MPGMLGGFRVQLEISVEDNQPQAKQRKVGQLGLSVLEFEANRASLALRKVHGNYRGELQICQVGDG